MLVDTPENVTNTTQHSLKQNLVSWLHTQLGTEKKGTIASLDGIRAIACMMVIWFHINLLTREQHFWHQSYKPLVSSIMLSGDTGVTLFFILSGILLFMPYAKALLYDRSWPDFKQFYMRRAMRILPGYYLSLFLLVTLQQPEYLRPDHWKRLLLFVVFLMDFSRSTFQLINGPYWTLAVEWQFYMLLPLIAFGFRAVVRRFDAAYRLPAIIGCLMMLIAWGLFSRYMGSRILTGHLHIPAPQLVVKIYVALTYGILGKFLEDFAVGMLVSLIYIYFTQEGKVHQIKKISGLLWGGGILLLIFMAMRHYAVDFQHNWRTLVYLFQSSDWLNQLGFSLAYGAMILAILFGPASLRAFFEWTPLRWIGVLSYGLYIWHLPFLNVFDAQMGSTLHLFHPYISYNLYFVWVALIVTPFCFLFYKFVELPGMRLSDRFRDQMQARKRSAQLQRQSEDITVKEPATVS